MSTIKVPGRHVTEVLLTGASLTLATALAVIEPLTARAELEQEVASSTVVACFDRVARTRLTISVETGPDHACALHVGGEVRCWGAGASGALGYGDTADVAESEAEFVSIGGRVRQLALGAAHSCALLYSGRVRCWGASEMLGYEATEPIGDDELPEDGSDVELGGRAVEIAAGLEHTCARLSTGAIRCWGEGQEGALGYGTSDDVTVPAAAGDVPVGGNHPVAQVAAGSLQTCVRFHAGGVRCWGNIQGYGEPLGDDEPASTALERTFGGRVTDLAVGMTHYCVVVGRSEVACGGFKPYTFPGDFLTAGDFGTRIVALDAGAFFSCALLATGDTRCWGHAADGKLGVSLEEAGGFVVPFSQAITVPQGTPARSLSLAEQRSCAVLASNEISCWPR